MHFILKDKIQDDVEKTQSESLHLFGCRCTSPRLEIEAGQTSPDFAGVYLYQGISNGKPYFKQESFVISFTIISPTFKFITSTIMFLKLQYLYVCIILQDNEEKSVANKKEALPGTPLLRRKRFIGRVDGGGQSSSTTARNWMQPGELGLFHFRRLTPLLSYYLNNLFSLMLVRLNLLKVQ